MLNANLRNLLLSMAALLGSGCAASVATTAVAAGAAGYERAHGRCVAACTPGNVCNPDTGLCDPIPCAQGCAPGTSCVVTPNGSRCEPQGSLTVDGAAR